VNLLGRRFRGDQRMTATASISSNFAPAAGGHLQPFDTEVNSGLNSAAVR
jgi:hypothetical protein